MVGDKSGNDEGESYSKPCEADRCTTKVDKEPQREITQEITCSMQHDTMCHHKGKQTKGPQRERS